MAKLRNHLSLILIFIACACSTNTLSEDKVLAKYKEEELRLSDIAETLSSIKGNKDSILMVNNLVEKWLKNKILLDQATETNKIDLNSIDIKVNEYKNALMIYEFQKKLISETLDTSISEKEYSEFYNSHQQDFELRQNIVKGILIKAKENEYGLQKLSKEIKKSTNCDQSAILAKEFCIKFAKEFTIETQNWITFDALAKGSPFLKIQNKTDWLIHNNLSLISEQGYSYLIHICECKLENRISPIDYVKEQIKSIILNARKEKILADFEQDIYKKALSEKQIQKYN